MSRNRACLFIMGLVLAGQVQAQIYYDKNWNVIPKPGTVAPGAEQAPIRQTQAPPAQIQRAPAQQVLEYAPAATTTTTILVQQPDRADTGVALPITPAPYQAPIETPRFVASRQQVGANGRPQGAVPAPIAYSMTMTAAPRAVVGSGYAPQTPNDNTPYRFNMIQNGKKMTADDFDAWMKARGIRVVK